MYKHSILTASVLALNVVVYRFYSVYSTQVLAVSMTILAVFAIHHIFIYPFFLSPLRNLPEPTGAKFPWAHAEYIRKVPNSEPLRDWINSVPNEGLIRFRVLLNQERLLITSPEALREVLLTRSYDWIRPEFAAFLFREVLGNGVLVAEGDEHKRQRKALMPAFSFRHIKDLYPIFWKKARQSTDEIAAASSKQVALDQSPAQSAYGWAGRVTLDIIGCAAMGFDFDSVGNPKSEILKIYHRLFSNESPLLRWHSMGFELPIKYMMHLPIPPFNRLTGMAMKIKNIGVRAIQEKHKLLEKGSLTDVDILSIAMKSGQFSDEDLANQLMVFLAAGHETTASALTWALWFLCRNPDIQSRLRKEIRRELSSITDPDSMVTAAQVDTIQYLNAVCNEVLRVMPSAPMTMREAGNDTEIQGQHIPKGTIVYISPWAVNTSTDLWGLDALTFNPDRWMGEGKANAGGASSNFAYLTFLHGPRSCIGKDFAKGEFLCLLAAWIGRFEVELADESMESDMTGAVTVKPKHGLPVIFKQIDGW